MYHKRKGAERVASRRRIGRFQEIRRGFPELIEPAVIPQDKARAFRVICLFLRDAFKAQIFKRAISRFRLHAVQHADDAKLPFRFGKREKLREIQRALQSERPCIPQRELIFFQQPLAYDQQRFSAFQRRPAITFEKFRLVAVFRGKLRGGSTACNPYEAGRIFSRIRFK